MRRATLILVALAAVIPVARADEDVEATQGLWPFFYHRREGRLSETGILGPLIRIQSGPDHAYGAFLPLFSYERDDRADLTDLYLVDNLN